MIKSNKKCLGVIVARGGSVGVPRKNLREIGGRSLLEWVGEAAKKAKKLDDLILSTDDLEIMEMARKIDVDVPFTRPAELSTGTAKVVDVLDHALRWALEKGLSYDYVALLQPTSPFVYSADIDKAVNLAISKQADTVISSYRAEHVHPSKLFFVDAEGLVSWMDKNTTFQMVRRQDQDEVFVRTGLFYVVRADLILERKKMYGEKVYNIEVPIERAICIDSELDLEYAEFLFSKQKIKPSEGLNL